jgi:propionyl-CoA carboxylase alpha chain
VELAKFAIVAASLDHIARRRHTAWQAMQDHARCVFIGGRRIDLRFGVVDAEFCIRLSNSSEVHRCQTRWQPGLKLWTGTIDGMPVFMRIQPLLHRFLLQWRGSEVEAVAYTPREAELVALLPKKEQAKSDRILRCPMPGLLKRLDIRPGQSLAEGDIIGIIEAMKMETQLRAEAAGIVKDVFVEAGASLAVNEPILELA